MKNKIPFFRGMYELYCERFYVQEERATKLAHQIRNCLMESIYENKDSKCISEFHKLSPIEIEYFLLFTTKNLHIKMSEIYPNAINYLNLPVGYNFNDKNINARYDYKDCIIEFNSDCLPKNISNAIQHISHEYTHVLQFAKCSALGRALLDFLSKHIRIYMKIVPYNKRINEKEAVFVSETVCKDFHKEYIKFLHAKG
jgi:hypothetical protein